MPKLYGAPSYSRPLRRVEVPRPFDPDDMPLEAHRNAFDHDLLGDVRAMQVEDDQDEMEPPSFLRRAILPFGLRPNRPTGTR